VTLGEPILVDLHLRNTSQEELRALIRRGQESPFLAVIGATKEQALPREDAPRRQERMGIQPGVSLPPGRDVVLTGVLNKYVRIRRPGVYRVSVSWEAILLPRRRRSEKRALGIKGTIGVKEQVAVRVLPENLDALRERAGDLAERVAHSRDSAEVKALAGGLAVIEHPLVVPFLIRTLEADDWLARFLAVGALGHFDEAEAVEGVLRTMSHRDCGMRAAAIRAGARHRGRPGFRDALVQSLADPDGTVRARAVRVLTGTVDPALWRRFAELLRDPEQGVRVAAADALGKTGDPSVVGDLRIAFVLERDSVVRKHIRTSLTALAHPPEPLPEDARSLIKLVDSPHLDERLAAVHGPRKLNSPEARQGLVLALKSKCLQTRFAAITQVQRLKCLEAADTLIELMGHPDPATRMQATLALATLKHTRAAPAMARLASDPAPVVRRSVPASLAALGDPSVIPTLKEALKAENDPEVARQIRRAIRCLERQQEGKKVGPAKPE